ncbi:MAG: hypothetical protein FD129_2375, partial [bacterium]
MTSNRAPFAGSVRRRWLAGLATLLLMTPVATLSSRVSPAHAGDVAPRPP